MEGDDQDQKTEDATSKRLSEARDEGNLPVSKELSSWFMVVGILIVMMWLAPNMASSLRNSMSIFLEKPDQISIEDGGLQNILLGVLSSSALPIIVVFGFLLVMAVIGTMIQTDFYVGTGRLKFDVTNLSLAKGMKKIFSVNSLSEFVKSFFKLVVLGYLTYRVLSPVFDALPSTATISLPMAMLYLKDRAVHLLVILIIMITIIAVADLLFTRHQYFKGLRMTKQEVKDEHKQTEGDPMIKSRLRQIRMDKARRRMMSKVPNADVVITNPTHFAVALEYDGKKMLAPVLVAKGADNIAKRIREVADENDVPIISNPPLARALFDTVGLDEPVTPEHYRAVAEVISYVYKLRNKKK